MSLRFLNVIMWLIAGVLVAPAAVVKGTITDNSGEPLPMATVRLLKANADSTFVAAESADNDGRFSISNIKKGRYILQSTYIGYNIDSRVIDVNSNTYEAGKIQLSESSIMLEDAVVIGVATPIKVMEDTIEYNASSYTTPPNAVLNDLLKRLPGVEVSADGSISAQGETVKKILIDGEEFFADDPKVAAKNIPVEMVKKAQVITRKSDLARMTGVDDGEDEMVINLTIKDDMNKGWYGSVNGGFGPEITTTDANWNRYKGAFIANGKFGKNMITILGNANNVNDEGFSDNNGQRFRRFGGVQGVNTTQSFGVNLNLGNDKLRYGGNILYAHNDRENWKRTHRRNIFSDGMDTQEDQETSSRDKGHNLTADLRLKWEPDSFNTLDFRPRFSFNTNNSSSSSFGVNYRDVVTSPTTNSRNLSTSNGQSYEMNGRLIYNHNFEQRRGRSFSISGNYSFSNVHENEETWSRNLYWLESENSIYEDYQQIKNHTWNNGVNARLSWTEPLGNVKKGNFIEFAYMMLFRWNNADKTVKNAPLNQAIPSLTPEQQAEIETWRDMNWRNWGDWDMADRWAGINEDDLSIDEANSNSFRNTYFNQSIRVGYKKVNKDYTLNAGVSVNPQMSKSKYLSGNKEDIPTRWVWNYAPFLRFNYKFTKQSSLNAFYRGRSSEPSISQLQPVADTSDPMNVVQGNPNLNPSFAHRMHVRFQDFNTESQRSIMVMAFANFTQNAIASNVTTDRNTGARFTTYENVDGNWNVGMFTMFSQPFTNKAWIFNNHLHVNYSQNVGFTNGILSKSGTTRVGESFGIAYRPNDLELELRPYYNLQYSTNTLQSATNRIIHSYGGRFSGTWYTPFGLVLSSDINYAANAGYSEGFNTNEWNWNASISYMFLRNKNATIALEGKDLLNQHQSIMRTETAQAVTDTENYILGRYVMLTFTYNFSTFKGSAIPESTGNDLMRQGPPGSGMRPGGGMGGRRY